VSINDAAVVWLQPLFPVVVFVLGVRYIFLLLRQIAGRA
jgi:hypothetical protein